jgi:hypothetical protein
MGPDFPAAVALPFHHESVALLDAPLAAAFEYLDDFRKLSAHMEEPSAMMMGSKMAIETDAAGGRVAGSHVRMQGTMLGMTLVLDEVVTEREPPLRKAWQTVNARLLVIGPYRLGFELAPEGERTSLRVFIDYALPARTPARWLGRLLAGSYARWCTGRMAADAAQRFKRSANQAA